MRQSDPASLAFVHDNDVPVDNERDRCRTATRADLLEAVMTACPGISRTLARELFEATLEEIGETLTRGEAVKLRSFGLFAVRAKRARLGRNPRTGTEAPIAPRRVLTFKPSSVMLEAVNGRDEVAGG